MSSRAQRRGTSTGGASFLACLLLIGCSVDLGVGPGGRPLAHSGGSSAAGDGGNGGSGTTGTGGSEAQGVGGTSTGAQPELPSESVDAMLPARTWRLTHEQYQKSVLDLVGVTPELDAFKPESGNGEFANFSTTAFVRVDLAANYFDVATTLAEEIPTEQLAQLTSCDLEASCASAFIDELGRHAFRSPVPAEVSARLSDLFEIGQAEDSETGFRAVLAAILNSPLFLYRKEIGSESEASQPEFTLSADQLAELLSFSLLNEPPPDWLRELVGSGELGSEQLPAVLERLLAEPAFEEQLRNFLSEWLEVTGFDDTLKSEDVFPGFASAQPFMHAELTSFFDQSGRAATGLGELLLDPVPSVDPALDAFYASDPSAPAEKERLGVLALGSVLASHAKSYLTSPTLRGLFIRERFLCQEISLPPGFTPPPISEAEALGTARTTRELYDQHQSDPGCATCHSLTDSVGYTLEAYDGAGRFRTRDTTQGFDLPVDTSGELIETDVDRLLSGANDLSQALSESEDVKRCFARQAFRFYFGQVERETPPLAVGQAESRILIEDSLKSLLLGLLSTETTFRRLRERPEE